MLSTPMSMSMDTTSSKHFTTPSENAPDQEAVDLALYEAAKDGDLHAAFIAIQKGADLNSQHDIRKETALHVAAYAGHKDMVVFLVQVGANIDCQTRLGRTALHLATLSIQLQNRAEMATFLLSSGANRSLRDLDGKTARDYALEEGQFDLADLMDRHEATPTMQPIPASAIVPALVHAAASLHTKIPAASKRDMDGVVRSV